MSSHNRAVNHRVFIVGLGRQVLEKILPDAFLGPPAEAHVNHFPGIKTFRQIVLRDPRTIAIKDGLHKQPIVPGGHTDRVFSTLQQGFNPLPRGRRGARRVISPSIPANPLWTPFGLVCESLRGHALVGAGREGLLVMRGTGFTYRSAPGNEPDPEPQLERRAGD